MSGLIRERSGAVSTIKAVALALSLLPALWLAFQASQSLLGPRPMMEATHQSGDWAIRLLWITLAMTPLRRLLNWPRLILARRIFGLAAFSYALGHVALYVVDQKFNWPKIISEIALRYYLTIGFVAVAGLVILAATSGDRMIQRLGSARWINIHKLIYPIAILGVLHFYIQSKLDVAQPLLMTGLFYLLMGHRVLVRKGLAGAGGVAALATVSSLATMLTEAAWYRLVNGVPLAGLLAANFEFDYEIRVMWSVLAVGMAMALAQALFGAAGRPRAGRAP